MNTKNKFQFQLTGKHTGKQLFAESFTFENQYYQIRIFYTSEQDYETDRSSHAILPENIKVSIRPLHIDISIICLKLPHIGIDVTSYPLVISNDREYREFLTQLENAKQSSQYAEKILAQFIDADFAAAFTERKNP